MTRIVAPLAVQCLLPTAAPGLSLERTSASESAYADIYARHYTRSRGLIGRQLHYFVRPRDRRLGLALVVAGEPPPAGWSRARRSGWRLREARRLWTCRSDERTEAQARKAALGLLVAAAIWQAGRMVWTASAVADELPGGVPAGRRDGVRCVRRPPAPITYPVRAPVRREGDCP